QPQTNDSLAIGRIDRVSAPTAAVVAEESQQWRARLGAASGDPLFRAAVTAAAERMKATYNEELARQALGAAATPATPPTGKGVRPAPGRLPHSRRAGPRAARRWWCVASSTTSRRRSRPS